MRSSIIHIQSTSIEFLASEINADNRFQTLLYDKEKFSIINYVSNDKLMKLGYEKLKRFLEYYRQLSKNLLCEKMYIVATDSFREFNSNSVIQKLKKEMNISIISIDQKTECFIVMYGNQEKFKQENSCLLDISGYSTQLIDLTKQKENFTLFDFGQLKVKYLFEQDEYNKYYEHLKKYLKETFKVGLMNREFKKMYITGSFARGLKKMYGDYYDLLDPIKLEYKKVKKLFKYFMDSPTKTDSLLNSIPKKLDYFMNGYIIFMRMAKHLKVEEIEIDEFGFNEGFIMATKDNIEEIEDLIK